MHWAPQSKAGSFRQTLNNRRRLNMADHKPTNPKPEQKPPEKPLRIPTGNPGTRDDGPRPQTGTIPISENAKR